jgi:hypothetical protein
VTRDLVLPEFPTGTGELVRKVDVCGTKASSDPRANLSRVITNVIIVAPISYFAVMPTSRKVDGLERAFIPLFIANRVS